MAEASAENPSRFFCHKCSEEISPKLPEYVCPRCNCGFIEILERPQESDSENSDLEEDYLDLITDTQPRASQLDSSNEAQGEASSSLPRRSQRFRNSLYPRHGRRRFGNDRQQALAPILQEVIMQMTSSILGSGVAGGEVGVFQEGMELPGFPMFVTSNLASNPGDYAWGRGGLDAIITQLMNQLDGTGPPPLPQEKIQQIPIVPIVQEQYEKNLQCTVCMEDFKLKENVRKLYCEHCYHEDCIIPWLQLHGTCPVCRKPVLGDHNDESSHLSFGNIPTDTSQAFGSVGSNQAASNDGNSTFSFMEEELD